MANDACDRILGDSEAIRRVRARIRVAAQTDEPVLITGERGTGKELVARALHDAGRRRGGPWVLVDGAALCPTLAQGDLFGHERGAFTGATNQRRGLLEEAQGGTLFLDEVAHVPPPVQASLLRFLEYGTLRRVGGRSHIAVDARVVAATNADLAQACETGRFLPDLLDRLDVLRIHVPPLRERGDDVLLLARHFWHGVAGGETPFPRQAEALLRGRPFPGNVRELRNVVVRLAVALRLETPGDAVAARDALWDDPASLLEWCSP